MKSIFFTSFIIGMGKLAAAMLTLINDTEYDLKVKIMGSSGMELAEMVIQSQFNYKWTDTFGYSSHFGTGNMHDEHMVASHQPYTVSWYCMNGNRYSYCNKVKPESTVRAKHCLLDQRCAPTKPPPGPYPNQPEGQELYTPPKVPPVQPVPKH